MCHREMKSNFGLGQMQCWSKAGSILSVQWMAWVYAVLMLAGYRCWGIAQPGATEVGAVKSRATAPELQPEPWRRRSRRWSFNTLWRAYRQALWGQMAQATDLKLYFRAVWAGMLHKQPEKELWMEGLWNAIWGATRA